MRHGGLGLRLAALGAALLFSTAARASVPQYINYQGKLGDVSGNPLSGTYSFRFKLYNSLGGGTQLFSEDVAGGNAVTVTNGLFNVQIGSLTAGGIPTSVFDGPNVFLEVSVQAGTSLSAPETLSPRERLVSVSHAVHANTAEFLGTGANVATFTAAGFLFLPSGVQGSSGTFTATGPSQYSVQTSSGIHVLAGGVTAPWFSGTFYGDGSKLTGIAGTDSSKVAKTGDFMTGQLTVAGSSVTVGGALAVGVTGASNGTLIVQSTSTTNANPVISARDNAGTELVRVQQNGNVGIGTSAPGAKLEVNGGAGNGSALIDVSGANPGLILNGDATNGYYPQIDFRPTGNSSRGGLIESFSSQGGLWLLSRGGPNTLQSDGPSNLIVRVVGASGQTGDYVQLQSNGSTVGDIMTVTSAGNLGLGASSPAAKLDVNGNAQFGSGATKSTFTATPGPSTYALQLSSGASLANGGPLVLSSGGFIKFGDGTVQATAGGTGAATGLQGGAAGQVPYQSGTGSTAFLPAMASGASSAGIVVGNGNGVIPSTASLQGTANQVTVSNNGTTVLLGLPQNIDSSAAPNFGGLTLSGPLVNSSYAVLGDSTVRIFKNLTRYNNSSASVTGAIAIKTGIPLTRNAMVHIVLDGYTYDANSPLHIEVGAYFNAAPQFLHYGYINTGSLKPTIQLARETASGMGVLILGDVSTVWHYPKVVVTQAIEGHSTNSNDASGWSTSLVTDLSPYDSLVTVPDVTTAGSATTATNLNGGAANQIPYQTGPGATSFLGAPGANSVLFGNSGAPSWTNAPTLTGTNFTGIPESGVTSLSTDLGNRLQTTGGTLSGQLTETSSMTVAGALGVGVTGASNGTLVVQSTSTTTGNPVIAARNNAGTELFRVQQNGNVGIGTSLPSTKLAVDGGGGNGSVLIDVASPNSSIILNGDAANGYYPSVDLRPTGNSSKGGYIEPASISGGLVLYGRGGPIWTETDSPSQLLVRVSGGSGQTGDYMELQSNGSSNGDIMTVTAAGRLGLGAPAPATKLDVNGDAQFGSGASRSTFTATPGPSTYALQLSSGASLANGGPLVLSNGGFIKFGDGSVQTSAGGGTSASANNLSGGAAGQLPYQSSVGSTNFLPAMASGASSAGIVVGNGSGVIPSTAVLQGTANEVTVTRTAAAVTLSLPATIDANTTGNAATATALAANGGNCSPGSYPLGVDTSGNVESCTSLGSSTVGTATNLAGGLANQILYQSGPGATGFLAAPGTNVVLFGNNGAPSWTNTPTLTGTNFTGIPGTAINSAVANATNAAGATNISGGAAGQVPYQDGAGSTKFLPAMASGASTAGIVVGNGSGVIPSTAVLQGTASQVTVTKSAAAVTLSLPATINVNTSGNAGTATALAADGGNCAPGNYPLGVDASGAAQSCTALSAASVGTATNLAGGGAGQLPYQSGTGATSMLAAGTAGYLLQSNGTSAPSWTDPTVSTAGYLGMPDTRSVATTPGSYGKEATFAFKSRATMGLPSGAFAGVLGVAPWGDDSGGGNHELAFSDAGSLYYRYGTRSGGWGSWYKMYDENDASAANSGTKLVIRDGSGNFSAGTITANLTGTASNATTAASANLIAATALPYASWMSANGGSAGTRNWYIGAADQYFEVGGAGDFHYRNSADSDLAVIAGASGRSSYFNAGNVGVGDATPSTKFVVNGGSIAVSGGAIAGGGTTGTAGNDGATWRLGSSNPNGVSGANSWLYLYNGAGTAYHDLALGNLYVSGTIQNGTLGASQVTAGDFPAGGLYTFASNTNSDTAYTAASLQLREANRGATSGYTPPHLAFHWGGVVASQLTVESDGTIAVRDNPGTGYEKLKAGQVTTTGTTYFGTGGSYKVDSSGVATLANAAEQAPTFQNGWVNYGAPFETAAYWRDAFHVVHLKGLIKNGTACSNTVMFTMPSGYQPPAQNLFNVQAGGALGRVDIDTSGNVLCVSGSTAWVSLDGINFHTTQP